METAIKEFFGVTLLKLLKTLMEKIECYLSIII